MSKKSQIGSKIISWLLIAIILIVFLFFLQGNNYLLTSIILSIVSTIPFFYKYEKRKPEAREIIVVAVIVALAVLSRVLFAFTPGIKPTIAIIIIAGAALGKETGFMSGALTAIISNMFFGQGPWSVYQILLWGLIGYFSGILNKRGLMNNKVFRYSFAIIAGVAFSFFIDLLTVVASGYTTAKFISLLIPSIPFIVYYALGNVVFLYFLYNPMMKKLNRVKIKYGLIDDKYRM